MGGCGNPACCSQVKKEPFLEDFSRQELRDLAKKALAKNTPNERPRNKNTLLQLAVLGGVDELVRDLLKHPRIDVNAKNADGKTALHLAAEEGVDKVLSLLLSCPSIDLNPVEPKERYTPLISAIVTGRDSCALLLLDHPKVDIYYTIAMRTGLFDALAGATASCLTDVISRLLDMDKNARRLNISLALPLAAYRGDPLVLRLLLEQVPAYGTDKLEPAIVAAFNQAAYMGHADLVRLLLKSGADPCAKTEDNVPFLHKAVLGGRLAVVEALLADPCVDPNEPHPENGFTPLYTACNQGHADIVRALLAHPRIDVNAKAAQQGHPIEIAATNGRFECVQLLLNRPDFHFAGGPGVLTLYSTAAAGANPDVLRLMLDRVPGDVNGLDLFGLNALMHAVLVGSEPCVRMLLADQRVNVNVVRQPSKRSALMMAIASGLAGVVKAFLECPRVNVSKADLDYARECGYADIVALVQNRLQS